MKLESIESNSALWTKLAEYFAGRRDIEREKNDSVGMDLVKTAYTRGKIATYKEILGLAAPHKIIR